MPTHLPSAASRSRSRRRAVLVALAVAAAGAACSGGGDRAGGGSGPASTGTLPAATTGTVAPTPTTSGRTGSTGRGATTAPADIHGVDFRNRTYPADSCPLGGIPSPPAGGYPLHDGRAEIGGGYVMVEVDRIVYGDVTGDGRAEAVVPLTCSTGVGSGTMTHPWVFTPDAGAPGGARRLAFPALDEATITRVGLPAASTTRGAGATVADGVLTLDWAVWTPEDVPVFPSKSLTTHQRWSGTAWQEAAPPSVRDNTPGQ